MEVWKVTYLTRDRKTHQVWGTFASKEAARSACELLERMSDVKEATMTKQEMPAVDFIISED